MLMFILSVGLIISFLTFILQTILSHKINLSGVHVLITGGSSGIGKCLAFEAASRGANITILARNQVKLENAQAEIEQHLIDKNTQKVQIFAVDVGKNYSEVEQVVSKAEAELGPVSIIINSAGYSVGARFEELPLDQFQQLLQVNYIGSVYATRAVLPSLKSQRKGHIIFVSSQAGLVGIYGFTAYSASKFALRGLAEALQMELTPYNIKVTLGFPPDTDTPGFAEEEKTKPLETKLISQTSVLMSPEDVAKALMDDALKGKFMSSVGLTGSMLTTVSAGMSPITSLSELVTQVCAMGVFRFIAAFILFNFNSIVKKCSKEKDESKKTC